MTDRIDHNVFILGAGFSRPAGSPLINDFLERSRQLLNDPASGLDDLGVAHFRRVFDFKAAMAKAREKMSVDLDNIEELFGIVEMAQKLGSTVAETRRSMVYLIVKTLELCIASTRARPKIGFALEGPSDEKQGGAFPPAFSRTSGNPQTLADIYDFFAFLLSGGLDDPKARGNRKNSVITFNYDLVLDDAIERVGACVD